MAIQKLSVLPEWQQLVWEDGRIVNRDAPNKWGGKMSPPEIGAAVVVSVNSIGAGKVLGYFNEEGFLGVVVQPNDAPEWYRKQNNGNVPCHVFGAELK